jgi:carboxypeptidase Q
LLKRNYFTDKKNALPLRQFLAQAVFLLLIIFSFIHNKSLFLILITKYYMKQLSIFILSFKFLIALNAQNDSAIIKSIFTHVLEKGSAYDHLKVLCTEVGHRLAGSAGNDKAVKWGEAYLKKIGGENVMLQPCMVPKWVRGEKEILKTINTKVPVSFSVLALGNSVATDVKGISAEVVAFNSMEELKKADNNLLKGKLVFMNVPFNQANITTGQSYGENYTVRADGPSMAASKGAIGYIMRSISSAADDFPHTGSVKYDSDIPQIPACALGNKSADNLSKAIDQNKKLKLFFKQSCKMYDEVPSYNVMAEIVGSEKANEVIVVGGHLDSWDVGQGAHDDGTGLVHAAQLIETFKALGLKPKRTIRIVFFNNEENGRKGGDAYTEVAKNSANEKCIAAIESDGGGFTPRGFNIGAEKAKFEQFKTWEHLFKPYFSDRFSMGGYGGVDIRDLKDLGAVTIGFNGDGQRYFDLHHTANDTFDKVHKRELHLGAAAIASLVWLISENGL